MTVRRLKRGGPERVIGKWSEVYSRLLALVFLILPVATAQNNGAQNKGFDGQRILDIRYDPAKQPLDPRDLARAQTLKKGEPLRLTAVSTAIDQLYATGYYDDIQAEAEPGDGGVVVRFVTKTRWFIGHVGAEGKLSTPPNRGQITNGTQLTLGQPFDETALHAAEDTILRLFHDNGLYEAKVNTNIGREPDIQQLNFTFNLKTGKRAKYERPVITGNPLLPDETIIRATGWRIRFIGWYRQVTESLTRSGVNGVLKQYQSRDRLMATAQIKDLAYDRQRRRVKPTLEVNGGPKVRVRAVEAKVSKRTLRKYVPIYDERRVDNDLLVEGARNLRDYFQNQGYYDVAIEIRQRPEGPDQQLIEYVISRGQRFKLVDLEVQGNKYFSTETIRERMFLEPSSFRFRHGRYSEAMKKKDEENITNLYKSNGFEDVKVTSVTVRDYKGNPGQISVAIRIDEGPQKFVDKVEVKGVQQLNRDEIESVLSSLPGQPYSELNVAVDRNAILTRYYTAGFPAANFVWRSYPSDQPDHVNLEYTVAEGERKYVRDVLVTGAKRTKLELIQNGLTLKADDPLSLNAMTEAQKNLYNLGIFAKVDTGVQNPGGTTQYKYVLYDIEEANRYTVNMGIGAEAGSIGGTTTSISAPVGGTGFSPRLSLDLSRLNFLGRGHVVTLRGRVSTLEQMGSLNYLLPRFQSVDGRNITSRCCTTSRTTSELFHPGVKRRRSRSRSNLRRHSPDCSASPTGG